MLLVLSHIHTFMDRSRRSSLYSSKAYADTLMLSPGFSLLLIASTIAKMCSAARRVMPALCQGMQGGQGKVGQSLMNVLLSIIFAGMENDAAGPCSFVCKTPSHALQLQVADVFSFCNRSRSSAIAKQRGFTAALRPLTVLSTWDVPHVALRCSVFEPHKYLTS